MQWNSEGLALTVGESATQLCMASASTNDVKLESSEDPQEVTA